MPAGGFFNGSDQGITAILVVLAVIAALCVFLIAVIALKKIFHSRREEREFQMTDLLVNRFEEMTDEEAVRLVKKKFGLFFERYVRLCQSTLLSEDFKQKALRCMIGLGRDRYYIRRLSARRSYKRSAAAVYLGYFPTDRVRDALEKALGREKKYRVKIYIANSLADIGSPLSLGVIIQSLAGSPLWYQRSVYGVVASYGERLREHLYGLMANRSSEIQRLITHFAAVFRSESIRMYLEDLVGAGSGDIAMEARKILYDIFYDEKDLIRKLGDGDENVRRAAIEALDNMTSREAVRALMEQLKYPRLAGDAMKAMTAVLRNEPAHMAYLLAEYRGAREDALRDGLALVLSSRMEYLLTRAARDGSMAPLIRHIMLLGKTSGIIGFLNRNRDMALENTLLGILREAAHGDRETAGELAAYLDERILRKLSINKPVPETALPREERIRTGILYGMMMVPLLLFPVMCLLGNGLQSFGIKDFLMACLYRFNYYFAWYAVILNSSYIALLVLSYMGSRQQNRLWNIKHQRFLFKRHITPSITVIAPAYNEEANIEESVSSLLNLHYPDYEVIVVNDGSKDATLKTVIGAFDLRRQNPTGGGTLGTMPVRGLYVNPAIPNLLVIDKENGGKADSLNAGINYSSKEYFCGIDADSLLESDSLLKLISPFLDSDAESVAAGGNIFPVNGCTVDHGSLRTIGIPGNFIARLQTVEYIRSFMGGRIGWARINALLIISGAFGLFKKDRVIEAGGYLTSRGKFRKDTVGEDMELVVRLQRHMSEKKVPYRVHYSHNANCWTEVPESLSMMHRQRKRWHRGLLDIITFHHRLFLNPRYGWTGVLAFPYFVVFEVLGPWLEVQGYLVFGISVALGFVDPAVLLLLFTGSIALGVLVTVSSFIIIDRQIHNFRFFHLLRMLGMAVVENFGIRQVISMMRITGYMGALRNTRGWGFIQRKGFTRGS